MADVLGGITSSQLSLAQSAGYLFRSWSSTSGSSTGFEGYTRNPIPVSKDQTYSLNTKDFIDNGFIYNYVGRFIYQTPNTLVFKAEGPGELGRFTQAIGFDEPGVINDTTSTTKTTTRGGIPVLPLAALALLFMVRK